MRKIGNIKLNQFSKDELNQRKMNALRGGCECDNSCSCDCSQADTLDDMIENYKNGYGGFAY